MARVTPRPDRLSFRERSAEAEQIAIAFLRPCLFKYRRPLVLFSILILLQLFSVGLRAQGTITAIEKNRKPVKIPTVDVMRIPHATRTLELIRRIPTGLEIGDELVGKGQSVTVKILCGRNTDVLLSGGSSTRFLGSTDEGCNLFSNLAPGAAVNVRASGPTSIQHGEMRLGSRRTQYEIKMPGKGVDFIRSLIRPLAIPTMLVYEGEVEIQSPVFSGKIRQGEKLIAVGVNPPSIQRITPDDIRQAAEIYARLDVSQAKVSDSKALNATYLKLLTLHQDFLADPNNPARQTNLETEQNRLGIPTTQFIQQGNGPTQSQTAVDNNPPIYPALPAKPETVAPQPITVPAQTKTERPLNVNNRCAQTHRLRVKFKGQSWIQVTNPELTIAGGDQAEVQLKIDTTKKKPGSYQVQVVVTCMDCAKEPCGGTIPITVQVTDGKPAALGKP